MQRRIRDKPNEFLSHFPEIKVAGALSRGNQDVATFGEKSLVEPEDFSDEPLNPVPDDRAADLPAGREPEPCAGQPIFRDRDRKVCRAVLLPVAI
jgi:hypothetical protein